MQSVKNTHTLYAMCILEHGAAHNTIVMLCVELYENIFALVMSNNNIRDNKNHNFHDTTLKPKQIIHDT